LIGLVLTGAAMALFSEPAEARERARCQGHKPTISGRNTGLEARGHRRVIVGTPHRDVIAGSKRGDWIVGAGGRDVVCGGGGSDFIFVGNVSHRDPRTTLSGGPGADYIDGGFSADRINGGPDGDKIDGEFGNDRIAGARGNDFIRAQKGADRINAGPGEDHVEASSGHDLVHGGPGRDKISTGPGEDLAFGDRGTDAIHLVWGNDVGYGGSGDDVLGGGPGEDICHGNSGHDAGGSCEHRRGLERRNHPVPRAGRLERVARHQQAWQREQAARRNSRRPQRGHHVRGDHGLKPFERVAAVRRFERFLRRLQRQRAIKGTGVTDHLLRRGSALGHSARQAVDRRYRRRIRDRHPVLGVYKRSVERYRVRAISAAISNQIDRLRWTPIRRG
jgi:Ca2+-binding RTX toxin-like protein